MIKEQVYRDTANEFGCTIGMAELIPIFRPAGRRTQTPDEVVNQCILQSIDMGRYQTLQRRLADRARWGRRSEPTVYKEIIKELRNVGAKRRTV